VLCGLKMECKGRKEGTGTKEKRKGKKKRSITTAS
jgi:hypothetical protein